MGTTFLDSDISSKILPCVTACPFEAFKKRGLYHSDSDFKMWTYELPEIFVVKNQNYDLEDRSQFYIEEVRSVFLGRCYMICYLKPVEKWEPLHLRLKKDRDLTSKPIVKNYRIMHISFCLIQ